MFNFIKEKLQKVYSHFSQKINELFSRNTIDEDTLKELEILLISSDTGVKTTHKIINELRKTVKNSTETISLKDALSPILTTILHKPEKKISKSSVYLLVGINGSGKTTCAAKLAHSERNNGKQVLLVAADTFRAAAPEQLTHWAKKTDGTIHLGSPNQDPASVVFTGCERFIKEQFDVLIIDTAGRLQTKTNLMNELAKIKRIITRHLPHNSIETLLTVDAMLGQNSFEQAHLFKESTDVSGIILTKMDGTAKGGIVFSIADQLAIPVSYVTFGEQYDALKKFDATTYVKDLLQS